MCFSPEADLTAGMVIGAIGLDTLRHVRTRTELPLAALPLVFAAHQLIEAVAWWAMQGKVPSTLGHTAEWLYLAIAFGVVPILVPVAVAALEPVAQRRRIEVFVALGAAVAAALMYALVRGPVVAAIEGRYIAYRVELWHGGTLVALYVLATCGALLVSSQRQLRAWGAINLPVVLVLAWLNAAGFISLWCVWAAITSIAIVVHLRHASPQPETEALTVVRPG